MYGWAGKILRVNFSTGEIRTQDTGDYREYIGGMGIGYKIMYDEVPMTTHPYDPESKVIFGVGPLTGTGVPCSGRTNITILSPWTRGFSIADGHMGGHFGHAMKYAGYDAIVLEGASDKPVYLKIDDDKVSIEDASGEWGLGTEATMTEIGKKDGPEFCVACIGPAGENLVNMSLVACSSGNVAGGGCGAIMGSKKVKAISCRGTGSVKVADPAKLKELQEYQLKEIIGANNNHPVPNVPQSWAEYSATSKNRWQGAPGRAIGLAEGGPIDSGEQPLGDITKNAWRTMKGIYDCGEISLPYTVRNEGCSSCPVRCYPVYRYEKLAEMGLPTTATNTCGGMAKTKFYTKGVNDFEEKGDGAMIVGIVTTHALDDYGVWTGYSDLDIDFDWCYENGIFEKVLPADEFAEIPWQWMLDGDPRWGQEVVRRIALKIGEFSHLGDGSYLLDQRWNLGEEYWNNFANNKVTYTGYTKHHSTDQVGQAGLLYNLVYNRDCMVHASSSYTRNGLPTEILIRNGEEIWGPGFMDASTKEITPINDSKVKFAKWGLLTKQWHDSATLCNWVWPMSLSPSKERGYRGDLDLDAKYMAVVLGEDWDAAKVDWYSEKITQMLRVMTIISYNTVDMREAHDKITEWHFEMDPDLKPFEKGTYKMDREDWSKAVDMFYTAMGWDVKTGAPTRATLEKFDLKFMADDLEKRGLLVG